MIRLLLASIIVMLAACTSAPADTSPDPSTISCWRLVERSVGAIAGESWCNASDGVMPADAMILVHEPIYRAIAIRSDCSHRPVVAAIGPATLRVGEPAEVAIRVESPAGLTHIVAIESIGDAVSVLRVVGVAPLPERPGRYLFPAASQARVIFTSALEGRASLSVIVEQEISSVDDGSSAGRVSK